MVVVASVFPVDVSLGVTALAGKLTFLAAALLLPSLPLVGAPFVGTGIGDNNDALSMAALALSFLSSAPYIRIKQHYIK